MTEKSDNPEPSQEKQETGHTLYTREEVLHKQIECMRKFIVMNLDCSERHLDELLGLVIAEEKRKTDKRIEELRGWIQKLDMPYGTWEKIRTTLDNWKYPL